MHFVRYIILNLTLFRNIWCLTLSLTRIPSTLYVRAGNNSVQFVCTYTADVSDRVIAIRWQKHTSSNTFKTIANFYPPSNQRKATYASNSLGESFVNRSTLTSPTPERLKATLTIHRVECDDTGLYSCNIDYYNLHLSFMQSINGNLTLAVGAPDESPSYIYLRGSRDMKEGDSLNARCYAYLGTPTSRIRWWIHRKGTNVVSELKEFYSRKYSTYRCRTHTRSEIDINVTKEDNQAILSCTIDDPLLPNNPKHRQAPALNVLYRVRVPFISKQPDRDVYPVGMKILVLKCTVDANPNPATASNFTINKFSWYYKHSVNDSETMAMFITEIYRSRDELIIVNLNKTHQGIYICEAQNGFKNHVYTEKEETVITVVDAMPVSRNQDSHLAVYIVVSFLIGVILTVLVIAGVWIVRKRVRYTVSGQKDVSERQNSVYEDHARQTDVRSDYTDLAQQNDKNGSYDNHALQDDTSTSYNDEHVYETTST